MHVAANLGHKPYRMRRELFVRMIDAGLFDEDERIELLEGALHAMSPQGDDHTTTIVRLTELLVLGIRKRARVAPQVPFNASPYSRPEPDLALWPLGKDVPSQPLLVIEVAESSLRFDRDIKSPIYAAAGVAEYWIVDLANQMIEVRTAPGPDGYGASETHARGASIVVAAFPDLLIAVDDVLPEPA